MAKKVSKKEEQVQLGPTVREGELVFGVAYLYASYNDTFVHVCVCFAQRPPLFPPHAPCSLSPLPPPTPGSLGP